MSDRVMFIPKHSKHSATQFGILIGSLTNANVQDYRCEGTVFL